MGDPIQIFEPYTFKANLLSGILILISIQNMPHFEIVMTSTLPIKELNLQKMIIFIPTLLKCWSLGWPNEEETFWIHGDSMGEQK